jgi:hypothetical protein
MPNTDARDNVFLETVLENLTTGYRQYLKFLLSALAIAVLLTLVLPKKYGIRMMYRIGQVGGDLVESKDHLRAVLEDPSSLQEMLQPLKVAPVRDGRDVSKYLEVLSDRSPGYVTLFVYGPTRAKAQAIQEIIHKRIEARHSLYHAGGLKAMQDEKALYEDTRKRVDSTRSNTESTLTWTGDATKTMKIEMRYQALLNLDEKILQLTVGLLPQNTFPTLVAQRDPQARRVQPRLLLNLFLAVSFGTLAYVFYAIARAFTRRRPR